MPACGKSFTANVSHELKTPLTSISGYAELIEHHMASQEDVPRFAGEIHHNATRLLNMINDIIKLSELDATENSTRPMDKRAALCPGGELCGYASASCRETSGNVGYGR